MIEVLRNWRLVLAFLALFFISAVGLRSRWLSSQLERAKAEAKAQKKDFDNAQAIRRRVSDGRADRVRTLDDAGYRD